MKMFRPSLKASSFECLKRKHVFQFCSNILFANHTNAFGGKPAIWDFFELDVARNVNHKKKVASGALTTKHLPKL